MIQNPAQVQHLAQPGGREAPLGTYGKSAAASSALRAEKYALQSSARQLRRGFPVSRCLRWSIPKRHISIYHSPEFNKAHYSGLETCGSVWECPVCASKISERRGVEVHTAIALHRAAGGEVLLGTFTSPHYFGDALPPLLDGQLRAMRAMWSYRATKRYLESIGCIGTIRALEVTHGVNGWHPHHHVLFFVRSGLDLDMVKLKLYEFWSTACRLQGLPMPSFKHGVDVRNGDEAQKYVTKGMQGKWGLEQEVTKGHIKKGRAESRTPFDLLRSYKAGDKQAGALFVEYAESFKGKRQLVWSPGLKGLFSIGEVSDLELADREEEDAEFGYQFCQDDWTSVLQHDARAEMLQAYEQGGPVNVALALRVLRGGVEDIHHHQTTTVTAADMGMTEEQFSAFLIQRAERLQCTVDGAGGAGE